MKHQIPHCPDCDQEMEIGVVPDFSLENFHLSYPDWVSYWIPGTAEQKEFSDMADCSKPLTERPARAITSYRCPSCGLLKEYAL